MEMEKVDWLTEGFNHFGIKCHDWEGEEIYADDDEEKRMFSKV